VFEAQWKDSFDNLKRMATLVKKISGNIGTAQALVASQHWTLGILMSPMFGVAMGAMMTTWIYMLPRDIEAGQMTVGKNLLEEYGKMFQKAQNETKFFAARTPFML
jgi:hypothetical protein